MKRRQESSFEASTTKKLKESMESSVDLPPQGVSRAAVIQKYPKTSKLRFSLNGQPVEVDNPDPRQLLVHWLRQSGHPGTKVCIVCRSAPLANSLRKTYFARARLYTYQTY